MFLKLPLFFYLQVHINSKWNGTFQSLQHAVIGDFFAFSNALVGTSKIITVGFLPIILLFGMVTDLAIFKGLTNLGV